VDDAEEQLAVLAARGDERALRSLWAGHRDAVYRFACWMLQDAAAAEDVVQDCFMALLEQPVRFDSARACLRTFLLGIARNQCRSRWRRLASEVTIEEDSMGYDPQTLDCMAADQANVILQAAVGRLPPLQREALFLFEYEGLSLKQAAGVARVGVGTFKARLHRGREGVKRQLAWLAKERS
jgi:RNA polymerase sigma-70 factor (ECF subfamily)